MPNWEVLSILQQHPRIHWEAAPLVGEALAKHPPLTLVKMHKFLSISEGAQPVAGLVVVQLALII